MAILQIRNLDEGTRQAIERRARRNRRSAAAEAAVILEEAVGTERDQQTRRQALLAEIQRDATSLPGVCPDVEQLVAEDRRR